MTQSMISAGSHAPSFSPGDIAGEYRIERLIAIGGMGEVYEARPVDATGSAGAVAIKTIRSDRAMDDSARRRFQRECELVARLDHPSIARTYGTGTAGSVTFLILELLHGETLAERIARQGPMSADEALKLLEPLAAALAYAHSRGIVHRDIKPSNIFADGDRIVLADFGVARSSLETTTISDTGSLIGTAAYLAPEQVIGESATSASDIYALGVVLFEILTGRLPFAGHSTLAQAVARLTQDPTPLRALLPHVDPPLEQFVAACLSHDPAERPATAAAFVSGLKASLGTSHPSSTRRAFLGTSTIVIAVAALGWRGHAVLKRSSDRDAGLPFQVVASMRDARDGHTATLLRNGHVLIAGGTNGSVLDSAEIFDSQSGTLHSTGRMREVRRAHVATLLRSGRVLIAGGDGARSALGSAELFDGAEFLPTGSMATPRDAHSATLLSDGRVLIAGGGYAKIRALRSCEIFDESAGAFRSGPDMISARFFHAAVRLKDGRVLIVGGWGGEPDDRFMTLDTSEIFDPATGRFDYSGRLNSSRYAPSATLLRDGRVLVVGGYGPGNVARASAEIFDPRSGTFSDLIPLQGGRVFHTATLVFGGSVLVAGGQVGAEVEAPAEIFDPSSNSFASAGRMAMERYGHVAALLPDGTVLLAGGSNGGYQSSVELFRRRPASAANA